VIVKFQKIKIKIKIKTKKELSEKLYATESWWFCSLVLLVATVPWYPDT
jgi:hypothetical protein